MGSVALTPTASLVDRVYGPADARAEWLVTALVAPELRVQLGPVAATVTPAPLGPFAYRLPGLQRQRLELLPLVRDFAGTSAAIGGPPFEQLPYSISHIPNGVNVKRLEGLDVRVDAVPPTAGRAHVRNGSAALMLLDANLVLVAIGPKALGSTPEVAIQTVESLQEDLRGVLLGVVALPDRPAGTPKPRRFCAVL
jgi:hypothetical protein